jgi:hypothetical protein
MEMVAKNKGIFFCIFLLFTTLTNLALATNSITTPCGGPTDLLSIVNRPSQGDNACVAPVNSTILETGYQYLDLLDGGSIQNYPQGFVRIGLDNKFEIDFLLPNYVHQKFQHQSERGFNASILGIKHEISSSSNLVISIDSYVILPSGSAAFGSRSVGGIFNGVFTYNLNSEISLSGMLGGSTSSQSIEEGGEYYSSINPDLVLSWSKEKINIYGEIYGQSKTAPDQGSGFNMDAGVLYSLRKNIVIDLSIGKRISGELFGFTRYISTGISLQFT